MTRARTPPATVLLDTSVAVALLIADHEANDACRAAVAGHNRGMAGHAIFETLSVMTRLPGVHRRTVASVSAAVRKSFPDTRYLDASGADAAVRRMAEQGIGGGAVYDALVAAAAVHHDLPLVSRDQRALATYTAMGARLMFVS